MMERLLGFFLGVLAFCGTLLGLLLTVVIYALAAVVVYWVWQTLTTGQPPIP